jgi:ribosomal protein S15P/S13E
MPKTEMQLREAAQALRERDAIRATHLADEARAAARESQDQLELAYTLRHTADIASRVGAYEQATMEITEAISIYREHLQDHTLDLANALRVAALNQERSALAAWYEAKELYASVDVSAGVQGATQHIQQLSETLGGIS